MQARIEELERRVQKLEHIREMLLADIYVCKLETQMLLGIIDTLNNDISSCFNRGANEQSR